MTTAAAWIDVPADILPSVVGVAILAVITVAVLTVFRVPGSWTPAVAIARGVVQLAVISVILAGIISHIAWIAVALAVMFTVASTVAAGRIGWSPRNALVMGSSMAAGILTAGVTVFLTGALEFTPRYALAIGAIIVGNSMSIATLAGRRFAADTADHWDEVEGWLALGARPRTATIRIARRAVREALVPTIDQTKTTGLVVLPGAFVGAIFGGISPLEAGRFQIVVLAAILAAGSVTAVLVVRWMGDVRVKPAAVH